MPKSSTTRTTKKSSLKSPSDRARRVVEVREKLEGFLRSLPEEDHGAPIAMATLALGVLLSVEAAGIGTTRASVERLLERLRAEAEKEQVR